MRAADGVRYLHASGGEVTDEPTLERVRALAIPPAWRNVWISPDPSGHIQATGIDSRGRTQYRYHDVWREQRDAQKFEHMLRFAGALPVLRAAALKDLRRRRLDRSRVAAAAVRLIDLGLFRIGGEKYAELDHHYGVATLEKRHVTIRRDGAVFDYVAKERQAPGSDRPRSSCACDCPRARRQRQRARRAVLLGEWRRLAPLHSHDVSAYIAGRARGHYTAKEFRTWNATVLMALLLANAGPPASTRQATRAINTAVRSVADWLGDTPTVARSAYIDPRLISLYASDRPGLVAVPPLPAHLPADREAELAAAAVLTNTRPADGE